MKPQHRRLLAAAAIVVGVGASALRLGTLDFGTQVSLDVLDLIPADEKEAELVFARQIAGEAQARVILVALAIPETAAAAVRDRISDTFKTTLAAAAAMEQVVRMGDPQLREDFGAFIFDHRFELLFPGWLAKRKAAYMAAGATTPWPEWLAATAADELESFLATAEAMAFEKLLPADPLLLVPGLVERSRGIGDTALLSQAGEHSLFWARARASQLDPDAQAATAGAIDAALAAAQKVVPETAVRWTGVSRFASHSREQIKAEVARLNILSIAVVVALAAFCLQRTAQILHVLPIVLASLLGAWAFTMLVVERVHVLVLVVGALLCGIAIDFSFHVLLHRADDAKNTGGYRGRLRGVVRPLLIGAFTSAAGFSFLLLSELPFIRHLGIFVASGLISAVLATLLWFAVFEHAHAEPRPLAEKPFRKLRGALRREDGRPRAGMWVLAIAAGSIAIAGAMRVTWHDDIRELEPPAPQLYENDREIRALFGETPGMTTFFTTGVNVAAAKAAHQRFLIWHETTYPDAQVASMAFAVPQENEYTELPDELERLEGFASAFRTALEANDFNAEQFESFFTDFAQVRAQEVRDRPGYNELVRAFASELRGPLSMTMGVEAGNAWFSSISDMVDENAPSPPPETETIRASQVQSLNEVFTQYRRSALRLSLFGVGIAALGVLVAYGPRTGAVVFLTPAMACAFALGVLGLTGQTLNLFHLLGVFLGACLSFDYGVFRAESRKRNQPLPASIRLSGLTTSASFAVLATSSIPVVAALGTTVALIVFAALIIVELS